MRTLTHASARPQARKDLMSYRPSSGARDELASNLYDQGLGVPNATDLLAEMGSDSPALRRLMQLSADESTMAELPREPCTSAPPLRRGPSPTRGRSSSPTAELSASPGRLRASRTLSDRRSSDASADSAHPDFCVSAPPLRRAGSSAAADELSSSPKYLRSSSPSPSPRPPGLDVGSPGRTRARRYSTSEQKGAMDRLSRPSMDVRADIAAQKAEREKQARIEREKVRALTADPFKVASEEEAELWQPLKHVLDGTKKPGFPDGAARYEAASALIGNFFNVTDDVVNTSVDKNIIGKPLTQTGLHRVPAHQRLHVSQALRETARRLIGVAPNAKDALASKTSATLVKYICERLDTTGLRTTGPDGITVCSSDPSHNHSPMTSPNLGLTRRRGALGSM